MVAAASMDGVALAAADLTGVVVLIAVDSAAEIVDSMAVDFTAVAAASTAEVAGSTAAPADFMVEVAGRMVEVATVVGTGKTSHQKL